MGRGPSSHWEASPLTCQNNGTLPDPPPASIWVRFSSLGTWGCLGVSDLDREFYGLQMAFKCAWNYPEHIFDTSVAIFIFFSICSLPPYYPFLFLCTFLTSQFFLLLFGKALDFSISLMPWAMPSALLFFFFFSFCSGLNSVPLKIYVSLEPQNLTFFFFFFENRFFAGMNN